MTAIWALIPNWLKMTAAAVLAAFLCLGAGYWAGKRDGQSSVKIKIERQNNDATEKALGAVLNYDECIDAGGVWTFRTGKCERRP